MDTTVAMVVPASGARASSRGWSKEWRVEATSSAVVPVVASWSMARVLMDVGRDVNLQLTLHKLHLGCAVDGPTDHKQTAVGVACLSGGNVGYPEEDRVQGLHLH